MATIYYTCFDSPLGETLFNSFLKLLPAEEKLKNSQYQHWEDRQRHLLSRVLLIHAANTLNITDPVFPIKKQTGGKPYSDHFYFNISHSGNFVAIAVSRDIELGLDIQKIADVSRNDFGFFLTAAESNNALSSSNPFKSIADLWSMKEAIAKGNGKGILLPLSKIRIEKDKGFIYDTEWFLHEFSLNPNYVCWLATNIFIVKPECHFIDACDFYHAEI